MYFNSTPGQNFCIETITRKDLSICSFENLEGQTLEQYGNILISGQRSYLVEDFFGRQDRSVLAIIENDHEQSVLLVRHRNQLGDISSI